MSARPVYKDNAYEIEFTVRKKSAASGDLVPATGIADLVGLISAAPGGAAINAAVSATLAERSGKPGTYSAILPTSAINAWVFGSPTYDSQLVYVCAKNADIDVYARTEAIATRPSS